jgi:hypothetical protein
MNRIVGLLALVIALLPSAAYGHGIWGHIHVTGWAIENLPAGELREFFEEPEVLNAALFGAAFTDSGYFPQSGDLSERSRAYSEHTHWEPFIEDFIGWVIANDPPPWDTLDSRMRVGFLIGCASHGLQDEIFDSLFLEHVDHHDGAGQNEVDPASDGFLALDEHLRWVPEPWVPMATLLELYAPLERGIDEATIEDSVALMTFLYVREGGQVVAEGLGNQYADDIPWTRAHYLDESIPGSLRAEINPTRRHQLALWERLHSRFDANDVVVATYPDVPRRLLSANPGDPGSTVTFVFGAGVDLSTIATEWSSEEGSPVDHFSEGTRWGSGFPRLLRIRPNQPLEPGGVYTAAMLAGAELISGAVVGTDQRLEFMVECLSDQECEPLDVVDLPVDGSRPDLSSDVGIGEDVGTVDVGRDSALLPDAMDAGGEALSANTGGSGCATSSIPPALLGGLSLAAILRRRR